MGDLQTAINAIHPNSTDEEWTRLLAEAMNAAEELTALRVRVEALEGALRDTADHLCRQHNASPGHGSNAEKVQQTLYQARAILSHPNRAICKKRKMLPNRVPCGKRKEPGRQK